MTTAVPLPAAAELARLLGGRRTFVLTGAGCSTESGIPDYRAADGSWKHRQPVSYQQFIGREAVRRRYWAGSLKGWRRMAAARPNPAHRALATLEQAGSVSWLVTQNVDGLHRAAGSGRLTELHGRLDRVVCLECRSRFPRRLFQGELERLNPAVAAAEAGPRPDGDAAVGQEGLADFRIPVCTRCGGTLKPDVVFFGEAVPRRRVDLAMARLEESDALLVVGSSLMVRSGYRFAERAAERRIPIAAVNLGVTRADDLLDLKVVARCGDVLPPLASELARV